MKDDWRNLARHGRQGQTQFWDDFVIRFNEMCGHGPREFRNVKQCKNKIDMLRKQYRSISSDLHSRTGNETKGATIDDHGNLVIFDESGQVNESASINYWPKMLEVFQVIILKTFNK